VARAALCASAMLLWLALPGRSPLPAECTEPGERASQDGWTLTAECLSESGDLSPVRGPARRLFGLPLDPDRASPASLETLPGVGPSRAAAIARVRSSAPFCEFAELERVPGIGPRTLEKLSGLVEIDPFACTGR
jgi:competence protein ComEA